MLTVPFPPNPLDVWTIAHMLVGITMGAFGFKRWFAYPLKLVWEIYQLYTHYHPHDVPLGDMWINSLLDTIAFAITYEIALFFAGRVARSNWWRRISPSIKYLAAFTILNFGGAFVMGFDLKPSIPPDLWQLSIVPFPLVWCPGIAALIVRVLISKEGFADIGWALNWKLKWPYYITAVTLPVFFAVAAITLLPTSSFVLPTWLQISAGSDSQLIKHFYLFTQLLIFSIVMTAIMFGQEFGWRSYFQARLFKGKPLLAAVITGLVWGLWLILITWRAYRLPILGTPELYYILLVTISLSIILGWMKAKTNSIWAPSLFCGTVSAIGGSLIWAPVYIQAKTISISPLGIWVFIPLICLCLFVVIDELRNRNKASSQHEMEYPITQSEKASRIANR